MYCIMPPRISLRREWRQPSRTHDHRQTRRPAVPLNLTQFLPKGTVQDSFFNFALLSFSRQIHIF
jgi:hypothetical protein